MAKPGDMEKLNAALGILDSTDLGLSLVWLWTWSTILNFTEDEDYVFSADQNQLWEALVGAVEAGHGFSLEYGAEQHYEDVRDWLLAEMLMSDQEEEGA